MDFFWNFNDTAGIWVERNILLMNSYWPRRAYLEVIRFQDTPSHPGEMRVGRDEQRPNVQIRAIEWVVADRHSHDGWRALRWQDLPNYLDVVAGGGLGRAAERDRLRVREPRLDPVDVLDEILGGSAP